MKRVDCTYVLKQSSRLEEVKGIILNISHRDSSNEGSQHMFLLRNKKNYHWFILSTPSYLELC